MIKDQRPLTYSEVLSLIGDSDKAKKVTEFIKEFYKMKESDAKQLAEDLRGLNLIKLKEEHIVNMTNFLPQDASDLSKVMVDVSLDQEEVNKILEVIKKY